MFTKRWEITCDQRGCFNSLTSMFKSDLKAKAKGLGWSTVRNLSGATHTCPACQVQAERMGIKVA